MRRTREATSRRTLVAPPRPFDHRVREQEQQGDPRGSACRRELQRPFGTGRVVMERLRTRHVHRDARDDHRRCIAHDQSHATVASDQYREPTHEKPDPRAREHSGRGSARMPTATATPRFERGESEVSSSGGRAVIDPRTTDATGAGSAPCNRMRRRRARVVVPMIRRQPTPPASESQSATQTTRAVPA